MVWQVGSMTAALPTERDSASSLMGLVDEWMEKVPILSNCYFRALREHGLSREDFVVSQRRFYFAVRYFSRPMAALMARLPVSALRQGLMHNLSEEHGFQDGGEGEAGHGGVAGFDPRCAHDLTFLAFLGSLGISSAEMRREQECPAVRAFNLGLLGACMMERTETAFACLGVIEYAFADISALIGKKVVERGWVDPDQLVHYCLHAEIDKRHAAGFFKIVESAWIGGGAETAAVEDGVRLGLYLFNRLYEDLAVPELSPDATP